MQKTFELTVLAETFSICQALDFNEIPRWLQQASFWSLTKTTDEYSLVCPETSIPEDISLKCESAWKCLKLHGPFSFNEVGIISKLTAPLADANIGVIVISTYDTDYILVKSDNLRQADQLLTNNGHRIAYEKPPK